MAIPPSVRAVQSVILLERPLAFEFAVLLYCVYLAHVRRATLSENPFRGVAELVLAAYGGGILVPMLLGSDEIMPFPLANDIAIPFAAVAYFLVMKLFRPGLSSFIDNVSGVKIVLASYFEAARCKIMLVWLSHANRVLAPSYFSHPIVGVIACGTLGGCGGAFFVGGGLDALTNGPSYPMISAFVVATAYHAAVNIFQVLDSRDAAAACAACLMLAHFARIFAAKPAPARRGSKKEKSR